MNTYRLIWSPEGKTIAIVQAATPSAARRKAPKPYRAYLGEIGVEVVFPAGSRVVASYRVPPFLADDVLTVIEIRGMRTLVRNDRGDEGWLDTATLTLAQ